MTLNRSFKVHFSLGQQNVKNETISAETMEKKTPDPDHRVFSLLSNKVNETNFTSRNLTKSLENSELMPDRIKLKKKQSLNLTLMDTEESVLFQSNQTKQTVSNNSFNLKTLKAGVVMCINKFHYFLCPN